MHARVADFGVTGYWKTHPDFRFQQLTTDHCCVICRKDHPLASRASLPISVLEGLPIVALNRDAGVRLLLEKVCTEQGVRLSIQYEVARVSTLVEMVASGLCVSVLTDLSTPLHAFPEVVAVPLDEPGLRYPIGVITPANGLLSASAASFLIALRAHACEIRHAK